VTFEVIPGKESGSEELFQTDHSKAMGRQPGFVSVGLMREQGASCETANTPVPEGRSDA
jgi:hypothetical protein